MRTSASAPDACVVHAGARPVFCGRDFGKPTREGTGIRMALTALAIMTSVAAVEALADDTVTRGMQCRF